MKTEKYDPNQVPCINCITLPICLIIFKSIKPRDPKSMIFINTLTSRCSILYEYLLEKKAKDGMPFDFNYILKIHAFLDYISSERESKWK